MDSYSDPDNFPEWLRDYETCRRPSRASKAQENAGRHGSCDDSAIEAIIKSLRE